MAKQLEDSVRRGARGLKVWKDLGLCLRDRHGRLIPVDDARLVDMWEAAGQLGIPVMVHVADAPAFFQPPNRFNERWEDMRAHPWYDFHDSRFPRFAVLIEQFEHLVCRHPRTTFIGAHVGCYVEDLAWVSRMLDTYPQFNIDISSSVAGLGRQPYSARRLFERHPDRILFGLDFMPNDVSVYAPYCRFLETEDEYFPYGARPISREGRWNIYGVSLPDDILLQVYYANAARLILRT